MVALRRLSARTQTRDFNSVSGPTLLHGLDWTRGLSWKQLLNNNPEIIHLLQHWRHHYRAATVLLLALPYKS